MKTVLSILMLLASLLEARENPFFPTEVRSIDVKRSAVQTVNTTVDKGSDQTESNLTVALDRESHLKEKEINETIDTVQNNAADMHREIVDFKYVQIAVSENTIDIETKDNLLKAFIADNPKVIILNFGHNVDFATKKHRFDIVPFYEVRIGAHKKHYSFVVELNDPHVFKVEKNRHGYILKIGALKR